MNTKTNETIENLLKTGVLRRATLPPENGDDSGVRITLPLIAEDYPAKTAIMWNAAYAAFRVNAHNMMVVASPEDAPRILRALRTDPRYEGGGAGIGFKEAVLPHLDYVKPHARAIGAVNIIKKEDGVLVGDNTDGEGYAMSLESVFATLGKTLSGASVLMLGAGGSGRAIAFALARRGVRLTIANRTAEKAVELATSVNRSFPFAHAEGGGRERIAPALSEQDAVVSVVDDAHSPLDAYATLGPMEFPVTSETIADNKEKTERLLASAWKDLVVSDIRIRAHAVPTLSYASALGFPVLDGVGMVVNQGVAAFWWLYEKELTALGKTQADVERVMRTAARL